MILLRQTQERSSRDSICDAITLISDKYETLYAEMRSKRRKMQCNYNPKTRLQNNNGYAEAVVYSARQSNTTLKREVGFKDKRSSIYYYTKIADIAIKLYKATFVIKLLI
ncbi:hypothetical protein HBI22_233100 [Parastagonospora nodorum]|nr:hypothetical protein HBI28_215750 [Parastagonospora nodorum]KAH5618617.1 hypothetical protein HBI22_233100 [Parastagonospora nodorum]